MLVEYAYSFLKDDGRYTKRETEDAIYNGLILVVTETVSVVLFLFVSVRLYGFLYGVSPSYSVTQILISIVLIDGMYYFYHKVHHQKKALYMIHKVHHIDAKFNLSLAVMLPWIGQASIYVMLLPLVLLHLSPYSIVFAYFFILFYQLLTHMTYIQFPVWCEKFLVTPCSHSVHHRNDRQSQSHNFGAVFSVWDRMLGTYLKKVPRAAHDGNDIQKTYKNFLQLQKETVSQFFK